MEEAKVNFHLVDLIRPEMVGILSEVNVGLLMVISGF